MFRCIKYTAIVTPYADLSYGATLSMCASCFHCYRMHPQIHCRTATEGGREGGMEEGGREGGSS
jgi:hypothetical protein